MADRGRRLRQLRHAVRARLGPAAHARGNARIRPADRPDSAPAGGAARHTAGPARRKRRHHDHGGARISRAVGVWLGGLPAWQRVVRARRRNRGGADPADARAGALLRGARLRGRPLHAARAVGTARGDTQASRGSARARAAGAGRLAAPRGMGFFWDLLARAGRLLGPVHARAHAPATRPARAACRGRAFDLGVERPARHRQRDVVPDEHQTHRGDARTRDRDRQGARVHPEAHRRDIASRPAARRRARRGAVARVAGQARPPGRRGRACSPCSCLP